MPGGTTRAGLELMHGDLTRQIGFSSGNIAVPIRDSAFELPLLFYRFSTGTPVTKRRTCRRRTRFTDATARADCASANAVWAT